MKIKPEDLQGTVADACHRKAMAETPEEKEYWHKVARERYVIKKNQGGDR